MSRPSPSQPKRSLLFRFFSFFVFLGYFLRALVMANVQLAKAVLFQKLERLSPGFLTYPLEGLSRFEILVLTHCITLTPGTTSVEISPDFRELLVHAFDSSDPASIVEEIKRDLEAPLLRWTR